MPIYKYFDDICRRTPFTNEIIGHYRLAMRQESRGSMQQAAQFLRAKARRTNGSCTVFIEYANGMTG